MSLLSQSFEFCTKLKMVTTDDGYGGSVSVLSESDVFDGAIVYDSSAQQRVAEAMGSKSSYKVITPDDVILTYHEIFRRERDKKLFRVTSDGNDLYSPASSALNIRIVTAEEWSEDNG